MPPLQETDIQTLIAHLRQSVGPERWRVWFDGATDFHVGDGGLTVGVANLFIADHLRTHFTDNLRAAMRQALGRELPVTYRIQPDLFQRRRRENLEAEAEALDQLEADPLTEAAPQAAEPEPALTRRPAAPFTLENFVVGPCNQMAYAAAKAAVATLGRDFHPLFIHAGCGLGKTHLLHGILAALAPRRDLRVACVSAEQFTNQYLTGMRTGRLDAFRYRYRSLDVLAIDDVHFLAGKPATQEEFLHTFNELDDQGRLVVLASDSHPRDLQAIQRRLISRWTAGLVVRMAPPDRDTRRRILQAKAVQAGRPLPDDVLDLMADRLQGSVRDLEGALTRLLAYGALLHVPITVDLARHVVAETAPTLPAAQPLREIEQTVSAFFGVGPADVRGRGKSRTVSLARQVTMVLARELTDLSLAEIARGLGSKHHTTVLAACRKWRRLVAEGTEVTWTDRDQRRTMSAQAILDHLKERLGR